MAAELAVATTELSISPGLPRKLSAVDRLVLSDRRRDSGITLNDNSSRACSCNDTAPTEDNLGGLEKQSMREPHSTLQTAEAATRECECSDDGTSMDETESNVTLAEVEDADISAKEGDGESASLSVSPATATTECVPTDAKAIEDQTLSQLYYNLQWPDEDMPAPTNGDADDYSLQHVRSRGLRRSSLTDGSGIGFKMDRMDSEATAYRAGHLASLGATIPAGMLVANGFSAPEPFSARIRRWDPINYRNERMMEEEDMAEGRDIAFGNGGVGPTVQQQMSAGSAGPSEANFHPSLGEFDSTVVAAQMAFDSFDGSGAFSAVGPASQPLASQQIPARPKSPSPAESVAFHRMRQRSFMAQQAPDVRPQAMSPEMAAILLPAPDPRDRIFRITGRRSSSGVGLGHAPPMPSSRVVFPAPTLWRDNWKGDYGYSRL